MCVYVWYVCMYVCVCVWLFSATKMIRHIFLRQNSAGYFLSVLGKAGSYVCVCVLFLLFLMYVALVFLFLFLLLLMQLKVWTKNISSIVVKIFKVLIIFY